jgi:hypothetical protein
MMKRIGMQLHGMSPVYRRARCALPDLLITCARHLAMTSMFDLIIQLHKLGDHDATIISSQVVVTTIEKPIAIHLKVHTTYLDCPI